MERLEAAAWPLGGGVLCAFVIAVVLKDAPWPVGFAVTGMSVAGWSLAAPPFAGALLGTAAWALVTGFDVVGSGDLAVNGPSDAVRAVVLIGAGAAAGAAGARMRRAVPSREASGWPSPPEEWPAERADTGGDGVPPRSAKAPHAIPYQRDRRTARRNGRSGRDDIRQGKRL